MNDWKDQDDRIEELERIMPDAQLPLLREWERHDWRPCWSLISEIGAHFKGLRYPTVQQKQEAWARYAKLRDEANRRFDNERSGFRGQSEWYRDSILDQCKGIIWSALSDEIFFFDRTTADQVKRWQGYLHEATQSFGTVKRLMLKEHRIQCCEKFDEVRESHRLFWEKYHEAKRQRQQEWQDRRQERIERTKENLQKNYDRLEKAKSARNRVSAHRDETQSKLDETTSEKWQGIFQAWLDDDQRKLDDIDASIEQMESWIEEDQRRLSELEG